MTINEQKQALGSWNIRLSEDTPRELLDALTYFGHIAIVPGRINPVQYGDALLPAARYVGVYLSKSTNDDHELNGVGMAFWLGDADDKGRVYETPVLLVNRTFVQCIGDLLAPAGGPVAAGNLIAAGGTFSGSFQWQTPRKAITYITEFFSTPSSPVEWRVNGNATLDAGPVANLYVTNPKSIMVRQDSGQDIGLRGLPGRSAIELNAEALSTKVVLLAQGDGDAVAVGSATAAGQGITLPYKDLLGNNIVLTRMVSESTTDGANANSRAIAAVHRFARAAKSVGLATDFYDIKGDVVVGDYLWVYDPDNGLVDLANQIYWKGKPIAPIKLRCIGLSWPVAENWTVAFRTYNGVWYDLSAYYIPESGQSTVTVGDLSTDLSTLGMETFNAGRVTSDKTTPNPPTFVTPFTTQNNTDAQGKTTTRVDVAWNQPTNTDGTTITDGQAYEIRYKITGEPAWSFQSVLWGETTFSVQRLNPSTEYRFSIRAVDRSQNKSTWSSDAVVTTPAPGSTLSTTTYVDGAVTTGTTGLASVTYVDAQVLSARPTDGTIDAGYVSGLPTVNISGVGNVANVHHLSSYTPVASDPVLVVKKQDLTWIILGKRV